MVQLHTKAGHIVHGRKVHFWQLADGVTWKYSIRELHWKLDWGYEQWYSTVESGSLANVTQEYLLNRLDTLQNNCRMSAKMPSLLEVEMFRNAKRVYAERQRNE